MQIEITPGSFFVFDLDDTLYQEIDFLRSAYRQIAYILEADLKTNIYDEMLERYQRRENVFSWILQQFAGEMGKYDLDWFLRYYREHIPEIVLSAGTRLFLDNLQAAGAKMGLITDGRSLTQRNKLSALGITEYFSVIVISEEFGSEKPDPRNYQHFESLYPGSQFYYFGDNTRKDFITPASLGWRTVCLRDKGMNIHKQIFDNGPVPEYVIGGFEEIILKKSGSAVTNPDN